MASYLFRFSYTPETGRPDRPSRGSPRDARDTPVRIRRTASGLLVRLRRARRLRARGVPHNVTAAAVLAAVSSTGSFRHLEAIVLIPAEDMVEALGRAQELGYKEPGSLT